MEPVAALSALGHTLLALTPEGWLVLVIMVLLAIGSGVQLARAHAQLSQEEGHLGRLQELLAGYDPEAEEPLEWEEVEAAVGEEDSLVREAALVVRQSSRQPQALEPGLAAKLRQDLLPRQNRLLPNLFMLLGLLGTVGGLAGTLSSLAPQVQKAAGATGPEQLARELGVTIGAMQGAFGASMWGILLAVVSSYVLGWWSNRQARFAERLERTLLQQLAPALLPRSIEEALEAQVRALKGSAQVAKDFQQTFSHTLNQFDALLKRTADDLGTNMARLAELSTEVQQGLQASTQTLNQAGGQLAESGRNLANAQRMFAGQFETATRELVAQLDGQLHRIDDLQATVQKGTEKALDGVFRVSERLDRTAEVFREEALRAQQDNTKFRELFDTRLARLEELLSRELQEPKAELYRMALALKEAVGYLGEHTDRLAQSLQRLDERLVLSHQPAAVEPIQEV